MSEITMESLFKSYMESEDRVLIINGRKYYKAVDINIFKGEPFKGTPLVFLPFEMFEHKPHTHYVLSNTGVLFRIKGPSHYRFSNEIPDWYFKCGSFLLFFNDLKPEYKEITDEIDIGNFFTPVYEV